MTLRRAAHDGGLTFCSAVGAYLVSAALSARLALGLSALLGAYAPVILRVAVGAVALDLSKAPGLLAAAWFLAPRVSLSPTAAALILVLLTYALEATVMALVQQASWLLLHPGILVCRLALAALLALGVRWMVRRGRRYG